MVIGKQTVRLGVVGVLSLCAQPSFAQQPPDMVALPSLPVLPVVAAAKPSEPVVPSPSPSPEARVVPPSSGGGADQAVQGELPVLPGEKPLKVEAPLVNPFAAEEKRYSYGTSPLSVLFLPNQIESIKEALKYYEDTSIIKSDPTAVTPVTTVPTTATALQEPDIYPVFHLSSVVFNSPADWSLWLEGHKITSRKNNTDVQVLAVSPIGATFAWKPAYGDAIRQRKAANMFVATDAVKNKMAAVQNIQYDADTGLITFQLKQNQSFSVSYFAIFEGYMESTALPPLVANAGNEIRMGGDGSVVPSQEMPVVAPESKKQPAVSKAGANTSGLKDQLDAYKDIDRIAGDLSRGDASRPPPLSP